MRPDAAQRFWCENTDRAVEEVRALGLLATLYARLGFPDIVELLASIPSELTEKIEEIMKGHSLARLQEAEFRAWRRWRTMRGPICGSPGQRTCPWRVGSWAPSLAFPPQSIS